MISARLSVDMSGELREKRCGTGRGRSPIRTLLVDGHPLLREGMRLLLARESALAVVGEAASVEDALREVPRTRPDVVVVDLDLCTAKRHDGLRLIGQLSERHPEVAAVMLTTARDEDLAARAAVAGARGYVVKDTGITGLLSAIETVFGGRTAFDGRGAVPPGTGFGSAAAGVGPLTDEESRMLRLVAAGHSNHRLGEELDIPESTVRSRIRRVLRKLGTSSRTHAVYLASREGWI